VPQFAGGDIWQEIGKAGVILVTSNSYVNSAGCLVMGKGAAREAALRWPLLPRILGDYILQFSRHLGEYGVMFVGKDVLETTSDIGIFQVKRHFRDMAHPGLITMSAYMLRDYAHRYERIALNYPGIGNGRLRAEDVRPLLEPLPDSVVVYKKAAGP
jgi:hypothetical protein